MIYIRIHKNTYLLIYMSRVYIRLHIGQHLEPGRRSAPPRAPRALATHPSWHAGRLSGAPGATSPPNPWPSAAGAAE